MTCIMIFCCESASPPLILVESVLLGLDAYSFCLLHWGFRHRASGNGLHTMVVYIVGFSLKVYSKYWAISLQPPSKMVILFYFLPAFNGRFCLSCT